MIRYEVLLLGVPEITLDEASGLETQLTQAIREHNGSLISFERWGKYRLAYPIGKAEYGVYFLLRFEAADEAIQALLNAVRALITLKYNEIIIRHLFSRLSSKAILTYQRPESLEDAPSRPEGGREYRGDGDGYGSHRRGRGGDDYERAAMASASEDDMGKEIL